MPRHTIRTLVIAGATALGLAVAGAGLAPAAEASQPSSAGRWTLDYRFTAGTANYTLRGHLTGVPGNAHSGQIWFDTSDDEDEGVLYDWNCPVGAVPPIYYGGPGDPANPPTTCVNLRSLYADSGHALPYTDHALTRAHEVGRHALLDDVTGTYLGRSVRSDYVLHGVGPTTSATTFQGDPLEKFVDKSRAARPTGHFGWISFNDPRLHVVSSTIFSEWEYDRS